MLSVSQKSNQSSVEDFLSTKEASEIVPYSREYIGRLAREKKVRAALVGGKWIVSASSLQNFYDQAKIEEEVLAERLRQERLVEQNVTDYIFRAQTASVANFVVRQNFLVHTIATAVVIVVGFLFFFSVPFFERLSNVAQLINFNQSSASSAVATFEMVEMTTPIDIANGIFLFPEQKDVVSFDPALLFSDEVEVVEAVDGLRYVRIYDGENFSDIPFVHLPSSYQYYKEVLDKENPQAVF
ncbi:MAG: helix-turn-helix domain-containing protein [Candidatus Paceibacteria bacterium]